MNTALGRVRIVAEAAILALVVAGFASVVWGALLVANLRSSPAIPWAIVVMALVLFFYVQYLGGRGWPRSTAEARRTLLRARLVPPTVLGWALLAGALALVALVGLWIVLVELTHQGGNPTSASISAAPPLTVALALVMGSFVSSISEECAFRGYAQVTLERAFPALGAGALSSLFFMIWHGPTQGFVWSKLLFYFLVGVVFGTIAFLTQSTVPAWPVHLAGDLIFFFLIWPGDATRRFVWREGPDGSFWLSVAQVVLFTALALLALRQLARVSQPIVPAPHATATQVSTESQ